MPNTRKGGGLLPRESQPGGLLGAMPQQAPGKKPNVLDRILGLYGADPATHIPSGQALGRGLTNAGIAAASISGRGHDRPSIGQHIANFMGTMRQTGPQMGAENTNMARKARIQQLVDSGQMGAEQLQAVMMELVGQGDYEGARSIGEVLKTMLAAGDQRYMKAGDGLMFDTFTQQYLPYGMLGEGQGEVKRNVKVAYPSGDPGGVGIAAGEQVSVPQFADGSYQWANAVDAGEADATKANRYNANINTLTREYEKGVSRVEPSFRLTHAALGRVEQAKAGDGAAQLALLYGFIRALDPNSVVREGEVRLAQEAAPLRMRAIQMYNNIIAGKSPIMAPEMADQLAGAMRNLEEGNMAWLRSQRQYFGINRSKEQLGGERMDLFRDPTEIISMGMGGGDPLAAAGQGGVMIFSQDDYDRMLQMKFEEDAAEEAQKVEEARAIWETPSDEEGGY